MRETCFILISTTTTTSPKYELQMIEFDVKSFCVRGMHELIVIQTNSKSRWDPLTMTTTTTISTTTQTVREPLIRYRISSVYTFTLLHYYCWTMISKFFKTRAENVLHTQSKILLPKRLKFWVNYGRFSLPPHSIKNYQRINISNLHQFYDLWNSLSF